MNSIITKKVLAPAGLNIRSTPSTAIAPIGSLPAGAMVQTLDGTTATGSGYSWTEVIVPGGTQWGWVATSINGTPTLGTDTPPVQSTAKVGIHYLQGGNKDNLLGMVARLRTIGKTPPVMLVGNDKGLANSFAALGITTIYRDLTIPDNPTPYSQNPVDAKSNGQAWVETYWSKFKDLDPKVYLQVVNEVGYQAYDCYWWSGAQVAAHAHGRKLALFASSVGTPEPEQWQSRAATLREGMAQGDIVSLHCYSKAGTPEGQLSPVNDRQYYELRYRSLYASVPSDCRPKLVISEAAREITEGRYSNPDDTVNWAKALNAEMVKDSYCLGACLWTYGDGGNVQWSDCDMSGALPQLETWLRGYQ